MESLDTSLLIVAGSALVGAIILILLAVRAWRRYRMRPDSVFGRIAKQRLDDVVIDDGLDGEIHLEHVLLTSQGILVVDLRNVAGALFGSERMDQWTVMDGKRRFTFGNPLEPLYARMNAVRHHAGTVPVLGRVVLYGEVDFAGGAIERVCQLRELEDEFRQADASDGGRSTEAFQSAWTRLEEAVRPGVG